jgi:hypothetical protein
LQARIEELEEEATDVEDLRGLLGRVLDEVEDLNPEPACRPRAGARGLVASWLHASILDRRASARN